MKLIIEGESQEFSEKAPELCKALAEIVGGNNPYLAQELLELGDALHPVKPFKDKPLRELHASIKRIYAYHLFKMVERLSEVIDSEMFTGVE